MAGKAAVLLEVPFHDVDILGIVWHGHYYKYFELARTALYRNYGLDIKQMHEMGYVFPVIESQCKYVQPLRYGQKAAVSALIVDCQSYIKIKYSIQDNETGAKLAYGFTKQAVCKSDGTLLLTVPEDILNVIAG